jgi:hypothetical protein
MNMSQKNGYKDKYKEYIDGLFSTSVEYKTDNLINYSDHMACPSLTTSRERTTPYTAETNPAEKHYRYTEQSCTTVDKRQ